MHQDSQSETTTYCAPYGNLRRPAAPVPRRTSERRPPPPRRDPLAPASRRRTRRPRRSSASSSSSAGGADGKGGRSIANVTPRHGNLAPSAGRGGGGAATDDSRSRATAPPPPSSSKKKKAPRSKRTAAAPAEDASASAEEEDDGGGALTGGAGGADDGEGAAPAPRRRGAPKAAAASKRDPVLQRHKSIAGSVPHLPPSLRRGEDPKLRDRGGAIAAAAAGGGASSSSSSRPANPHETAVREALALLRGRRAWVGGRRRRSLGGEEGAGDDGGDDDDWGGDGTASSVASGVTYEDGGGEKESLPLPRPSSLDSDDRGSWRRGGGATNEEEAALFGASPPLPPPPPLPLPGPDDLVMATRSPLSAAHADQGKRAGSYAYASTPSHASEGRKGRREERAGEARERAGGGEGGAVKNSPVLDASPSDAHFLSPPHDVRKGIASSFGRGEGPMFRVGPPPVHVSASRIGLAAPVGGSYSDTSGGGGGAASRKSGTAAASSSSMRQESPAPPPSTGFNSATQLTPVATGSGARKMSDRNLRATTTPASPPTRQDSVDPPRTRTETEESAAAALLPSRKRNPERRWDWEEEVEHGLERLLVAILERASLQQRTPDGPSSESRGVEPSDGADSGVARTTTDEGDGEGGGGDRIIEAAVASLFSGGADRSSDGASVLTHASSLSKGRAVRPARRRPDRPDSKNDWSVEAEAMGSVGMGSCATAKSKQRSVVEDLLAEVDSPVPDEATRGGYRGAPSLPPGPRAASPCRGIPCPPLYDSNEEAVDDARQRSASSEAIPPSLLPYSMSVDGMVGVEAIHVNLPANTSIDGAVAAGNGDRQPPPSSTLPLSPVEERSHRGSSSHISSGGGRVLGPLSKRMGGTTGVVLDTADGYSDDDDSLPDEHCETDDEGLGRSSGAEPPAPPPEAEPAVPVSPSSLFDSITESVTHAVHNAPSLMSVLSHTLSAEDVGLECAAPDRYSAESPVTKGVGIDLPEPRGAEHPRTGTESPPLANRHRDPLSYYGSDPDDAVDVRARDLMRNLCAHLLPYGVDEIASPPATSSPAKAVRSFMSWGSSPAPEESVGRRREWDESDPDEPGYAVHRLKRSQLRRVEREFERMVNATRERSEHNLLVEAVGGGMGDDGIPLAGSHGRREDSYGAVSSSVREETGDDPEEEKDIDSTEQSRIDGGGDDEDENNDDEFERDLEEAEQLLEREEKQFQAIEKAAAAAGCGLVPLRRKLLANQVAEEDGSDSGSGSASGRLGQSPAGSASGDDAGVEDGPAEALAGSSPGSFDDDDGGGATPHPDFPVVQPSGRGRLGELEYFNLPIIYKANVTGFEPTKDMVLEPGNVLAGQYLVQNELGSAAFSTAYRCIDLSSPIFVDDDGEEYHDEVCLKVIKNTKDFYDQSLDEIKILELLRRTGQCDEHNIVEMKTFFYHREHLIIVTELLRQNLFEFGKAIMDDGEEPYFTRQRLCYITRQVLVALDFIHRLGLVHSDVKPENILLSSYSRARVKLIDFGSSCYLSDRQSSYIQSRSYRAPEVILGLPYDGKIDIWSLGCVVAEMYTGEVTFQNDSVVSMLSRIEAICGPFPRHLIAQGRQSGQFFTASGLLYEKVEDEGVDEDAVDTSGCLDLDEDDDESDIGAQVQELEYDILQPKITTLAARLGFDADLMEQPRGTLEEEDKAMFVDFLRFLLIIDPDCRPTAEEALQHPWIVSGYDLTEDDIRYPSS